MQSIRTLERLSLAVGLLLLVAYAGAHIHRAISSRAALDKFKGFQQSQAVPDGSTEEKLSPAEEVDFGLWSEKRVAAYKQSLTQYFDTPLAVIRIPKIDLEVPVFEGTDDLTLNRGVGLIVGTAKPGQPGNVGIAGHRDGFFRGLKDISEGDRLDLITKQGQWKYEVDHIQIVNSDNVSVLADRGVPSITLVTCFPFYFIGDAPQRWIVQCSLKEELTQSKRSGQSSSSKVTKLNKKEKRR